MLRHIFVRINFIYYIDYVHEFRYNIDYKKYPRLLLLIHCFTLWLYRGWSLFWYALLCVLSSFVIFRRGIESWLLFKNCIPGALFLLKCSAALPHGAVGWSAVRNCCIS